MKYTSEFLISFEAWAKLAQQWLVCAPLGIHLESINRVNTVSDNIIIASCTLAQRENCAVPNKKLFGPMVCHMSLSKILIYIYVLINSHHLLQLFLWR